MAAVIKLLRSNSHGTKATLARAQHHARRIKPLIIYLTRRVSKFDCTWYQGDVLHVVQGKNKREYGLRGHREKGAYVGIQLSLKKGRLLKNETPLVTCYYDERNGLTWSAFADMIKHLVEQPA